MQSSQKVLKISNLVTRILGCNPGVMTLEGTNTYVVGNGSKRILIDTGEPNKPEYIKLLKTFLKDEKVDLEHIIITHWHNDHIGGVPDIFKHIASSPTVWKYRRTDSENPPKSADVPLNYLSDGQKIATQGATLKIISTPGHTTDHIILGLEEENSIFSGDCILGGSTAVFEDLHDYMKSLDKILKINPKTIYPGHGYILNEPCREIQKYIEHRMMREKQILDLLKENKRKMSSKEIVKILYADVPENLHLAAEKNVIEHLKKLKKDSLVDVDDEKFWKYNER